MTGKIINDNRNYFIGQHHSNDCNSINFNNINTESKINSKFNNQFTKKFIR